MTAMSHPVCTMHGPASGSRRGPQPTDTGGTPMPELTDRQQAILDFEREWWKFAGDRTSAVKAEFDLDLDDYHAELDQVIATDAAAAYDRMLVKRLRRLAAQRRRMQSRGGGGAA